VLGGHLSAERPRESWSIDCAPSMLGKDEKRRTILIFVDDFSKMVILVVLDKLNSMTVRNAFL
jgi:hypothetical protein